MLALIKKDKPEDELKKSMQAQMEVFLQAETPEFIQVLFETLDSKDYVNGPPAKAKVKSEVVEAAAEVEGGEADSTTPIRNAEGGEEDHADRRRRSGGEQERDFRGRPRRSPPRRRPGRYRSRSPPPQHYRGRSRSRSRSPYRRVRPFGRRSRSRSYSPPPHPRHRSRSPPKDDLAGDPYRNPPPAPMTGKRVPRCRDYDEKGFCMRGDQCKFDHGNDAVVLEDTAVPPPGVPGAGAAVAPYQPGSPVYADPYVPAPVQMPPLHLPPPGYPNPRKRGMDDAEAYPPAKQSVYDRLGTYGRGRGRGRGRGGRGGRGGAGSSQIAVRNIPPNMNNIAHLNNHFARFGTLVNVQVQFEGDPASALVSFSNPSEAGAAFNTPEAVLGNRFIKMHFHYERPAQQGHHHHKRQ